jgi:hypothetical protein
LSKNRQIKAVLVQNTPELSTFLMTNSGGKMPLRRKLAGNGLPLERRTTQQTPVKRPFSAACSFFGCTHALNLGNWHGVCFDQAQTPYLPVQTIHRR